MKTILSLTMLFLSFTLFSQENNQNINYTKQESIIKVRLNDNAYLKITDWISNIPKDKNLNSKFIVLNFWKSEFDPIINGNEKINQLQSKFNANTNLYFITLVNEKPDLVLKVIEKHHYTFNSIVASDQRKLNAFWTGGITTIDLPITLLIDNKGLVKWIGISDMLDEKTIQNFIKGTLEPCDVYRKIRN